MSTTADPTAPTTNAFSGQFAPPQVTDQTGTDEFTVPLNNFNSSAQVVGETTLDGQARLFMPGRVRKYIPTLYKQCWLNARAILSVNGFEQVDGSNSTDDNGNNVQNSVVTSDIRTSVLSNKSGNVFLASTAALRLNDDGLTSAENGMTKNVMSVGPNPDGTARTLTCDNTAVFMVNGGEYYNQYVFTDIGDMVQYVQGLADQDALSDIRDATGNQAVTTIYYVTIFEGFFLNTSAGISTNDVVDLNPPSEAEGDTGNQGN
jgi:hypothetical protein